MEHQDLIRTLRSITSLNGIVGLRTSLRLSIKPAGPTDLTLRHAAGWRAREAEWRGLINEFGTLALVRAIPAHPLLVTASKRGCRLERREMNRTVKIYLLVATLYLLGPYIVHMIWG